MCIWQYVCLYIEIYAYLSQRRTELHLSTVNTTTEALDIQGPDILNSLTREQKKKKRWHSKNVLTPALGRHQDFMNVFLITITSVKLQSYFIWNSPTYSAEQHSDKACTLCKTEVKFIQASGSCWWLWDGFFFSSICCLQWNAEPQGGSTWAGMADTGTSETCFSSGRNIRERKDVTVEGLFHWFSASPFPMIRQ